MRLLIESSNKSYNNKAMIGQKSAHFKAATLQSTDHWERGRSIKTKRTVSDCNIIALVYSTAFVWDLRRLADTKYLELVLN